MVSCLRYTSSISNISSAHEVRDNTSFRSRKLYLQHEAHKSPILGSSMRHITNVIIIYNPNSTGRSKKKAQQFAQAVRKHTEARAKLIATQHAGHAEEIAAQHARKGNVMIVSSSGDGGYHEVLNGAMKTDMRGVILGVLPAGNANDHYHALHHGNVAHRIGRGDTEEVDVIEVVVRTGEKTWRRYAHSYGGLGITPHIGEKLTQAQLNPFKEFWLVTRHFFSSRPVQIVTEDGHAHQYDSVIFSNIARMSKLLTVAAEASPHDGKFEVTRVKSGSIMNLVRFFFFAWTRGIRKPLVTDRYSFVSHRPFQMQLDGEVFSFGSESEVVVRIADKQIPVIM